MRADQPIDVAAAVLVENRKVLLARRRGGYLDNMWEFPGGKLETGESPEAACVRELKEELDIDVEAKKLLLALEHQYPDKTVRLHFVLCSLGEDKNANLSKLSENSETDWFNPDQLPLEDFCPADRIAANNIPWSVIIKK